MKTTRKCEPLIKLCALLLHRIQLRQHRRINTALPAFGAVIFYDYRAALHPAILDRCASYDRYRSPAPASVALQCAIRPLAPLQAFNNRLFRA
jgi:hypothetical protein